MTEYIRMFRPSHLRKGLKFLGQFVLGAICVFVVWGIIALGAAMIMMANGADPFAPINY